MAMCCRVISPSFYFCSFSCVILCIVDLTRHCKLLSFCLICHNYDSHNLRRYCAHIGLHDVNRTISCHIVKHLALTLCAKCDENTYDNKSTCLTFRGHVICTGGQMFEMRHYTFHPREPRHGAVRSWWRIELPAAAMALTAFHSNASARHMPTTRVSRAVAFRFRSVHRYDKIMALHELSQAVCPTATARLWTFLAIRGLRCCELAIE